VTQRVDTYDSIRICEPVDETRIAPIINALEKAVLEDDGRTTSGDCVMNSLTTIGNKRHL